jgi:hypothetical protein
MRDLPGGWTVLCLAPSSGVAETAETTEEEAPKNVRDNPIPPQSDADDDSQSMVRSALRPAGRVMFYCHDNHGLGHLRQALCLLRGLLDHAPQAEALLATGSPVLDKHPIPGRAFVLSLPPVVNGSGEYADATGDGSTNARQVLAHRASRLLGAARFFRPDILLVDRAPLGLMGELVPTLAFLRGSVPRPCIVLGGDIGEPPEVLRRLWREQGVYAALQRYYDRILVYDTRLTPERLAESVQRSSDELGRHPGACDVLAMCGTERAVSEICAQWSERTTTAVEHSLKLVRRHLRG